MDRFAKHVANYDTRQVRTVCSEPVLSYSSNECGACVTIVRSPAGDTPRSKHIYFPGKVIAAYPAGTGIRNPVPRNTSRSLRLDSKNMTFQKTMEVRPGRRQLFLQFALCGVASTAELLEYHKLRVEILYRQY